MDDQPTSSGLKDTARMHANRDEVRAGIPLLFTILAAGIAGALAARNALSGGVVEWIGMIGVAVVAAHSAGTLYSVAYSRLHSRGDDSE